MSAHQNKKSPPAKNQTDPAPSDPAALIASLTPAERAVLPWVCEGKTSPAIATITNRSPRTVDNHIGSILRKFGVETRGAAACIALEHKATLAAPPAPTRRRKRKGS